MLWKDLSIEAKSIKDIKIIENGEEKLVFTLVDGVKLH